MAIPGEMLLALHSVRPECAIEMRTFNCEKALRWVGIQGQKIK